MTRHWPNGLDDGIARLCHKREVLRWAYEGKTLAEISIILAISERAVKYHFHNIYEKRNASNRPHLLAKALPAGLILLFEAPC